MGFWANLFGQRSSLPAGVEQRDDHVGPSFDLADAALAAYIRVGAQGVGEIDSWAALQQPAYWRAVNLLAGIVATLPLKAYRTDPKTDERKVVPSYLDNPAGPYPLTPFDWKHMVMIHLLLHGEADLMYVRNNADQLIGLWPLHPTAVQVTWSDSGNGGKRFLVSVAGGKTLDSEKDEVEVLQILGTTLDGLRGVNPLVLHRRPVQTMQAQEAAANRMSTNGNLLSGLVSSEEDDLDEDDAKVIKAGLDLKIGGPENAGGVAFVNKKLKFTPWTMNSVEAQLIQSREFSVDEVGRMFGIPAHLLGSQNKSTSWGTGIVEMNLALQKFTLMPWTSRIEEAISTTLPAPRHAEFDYKGLFQGSPKDEIELLIKQAGNKPIISVNEARAILNLDPIKGQDDLTPGPSGDATPPQQDVVPNPPPDGSAKANTAALDTMVKFAEGMASAVVAPAPIPVFNLYPIIKVETPSPIVVPAPVVVMKTPAPIVIPAPIVNVAAAKAPNVTVNPAITVETKPTIKRVERNGAGQVERIVEEG